MKSLVLACLLLTGCSEALVMRLSTDTYWAHTKAQQDQVHVSEHPVGVRDHFGYTKRLVLHNPLPYAVDVKVECASMFQADEWYRVPAHRVRYALVTSPRELEQGCFLTAWKLAVE